MEIPEEKALMVMGHERVLMRDFILQLENNLGNVFITCKMLRINRDTFYWWCDKDKWFKEVTDKIRKKGFEDLKDIAEHSIASLILDKNVAATIFYLKTRHPDYKDAKNKIDENPDNLINYAAYIQATLDAINEVCDTKFEWQKKAIKQNDSQ